MSTNKKRTLKITSTVEDFSFARSKNCCAELQQLCTSPIHPCTTCKIKMSQIYSLHTIAGSGLLIQICVLVLQQNMLRASATLSLQQHETFHSCIFTQHNML